MKYPNAPVKSTISKVQNITLAFFIFNHLPDITNFDVVYFDLCGTHYFLNKIHLKIIAKNPARNIVIQQSSFELHQADNIQVAPIQNRISIFVKTVIHRLKTVIAITKSINESIFNHFRKFLMAKNPQLYITVRIFRHNMNMPENLIQNDRT